MASTTYVINHLHGITTQEVDAEHARVLGQISVHIVTNDGTITMYVTPEIAAEIAGQISNMVSAIDMANVEADMVALRSAGLLPEWREYGPDGYPVDSDDADYIKYDEAPYTVGDVVWNILIETIEKGDTI